MSYSGWNYTTIITVVGLYLWVQFTYVLEAQTIDHSIAKPEETCVVVKNYGCLHK